MAGRIWALDIETLSAPSEWVKKLRHEAYHRMQNEIEQDRTLLKGQRRYIDQRLTDPTKIAAAIEKKLAEGASLENPKDSLNPLTAKPICVVCVNVDSALTILDSCHQNYLKMADIESEQIFTEMSESYKWAATEVDQFLGFNVKDFDLPVLRMHLAKTTKGILPDIPALRRAPIELREELGGRYDHSTYSTPRDLRHYVATILDLEGQCDGVVKEYLESTFTGADVAMAYIDGKMDKIIHHCTLDALMCALIAVKMRIYR